MNQSLRGRSVQAAFIPGDGIGPEVAWAARRCVDATGVNVAWVDCAVGADRLPVSGSVLPADTAEKLLAARLALKGPLDGTSPGSDRNPNTLLEQHFEVFAAVRHCRSLPGASGPGSRWDLVVIGERAMGGEGIMEIDVGDPVWPGFRATLGAGCSAATLREVHPDRSRAFFEFAFGLAAARRCRKLTLVHRANVHRKADGAWLKLGEEVARRHPGIACEDQLADHVAMQMVRAPERFDVLVVTPLYGEVLGDLAVGIAGGVEFVPEVLAGHRGSLFTTVHGTAPRFAGLRRANPCAMILAGAALLRAANEPEAASAVEFGVEGALAGLRQDHPMDSGAFADAVVERIRLGVREASPASPLAGPVYEADGRARGT